MDELTKSLGWTQREVLDAVDTCARFGLSDRQAVEVSGPPGMERLAELINTANAYSAEHRLAAPPRIEDNKLDTDRAPQWLSEIVNHAINHQDLLGAAAVVRAEGAYRAEGAATVEV